MLRGRFGYTTGRPYLAARVIFRRLDLSADISFLVDTGADATILMPADAIRMQVPFDQLGGDRQVSGIGGAMAVYSEPALIVFADTAVLHVYEITLDVMPPDPTILDAPSLLGRDILDRWRMSYEPLKKELTFRVRSADATIQIP
jgi:gag-polyprotein putative aspartyl protease